MGIKIDSCYEQNQIEDSKNYYIYCCKKRIYNDNSNQIDVDNKNNDLNNNKKISDDNLPTNDNNIPKKKTMKNRSKKNDNNLRSLCLDKNITNSTFSLTKRIAHINKNEEEKYIKYIIKIQSYFRKYINIKKKKIKNNEIENIQLRINEIIYSTLDNDINSNKNLNEKINLNILSDNTQISSNDNTQFPFNIRNKNNLNYKYFGYSIPNNDMKDNFNKHELIKEGFGKMIFVDGSEISGIFHNNKLQGYAKYINTGQKNNHRNTYDEKVIIITDNLDYEEFIGEYKDYSPNGFGIYKNYLTNLKITGIFINNIFSGIGIEESGEGGYTYSGDFIYNKKEGYGKMQWKDGQKYFGEFKNNQMNGYGIIEFPGKIFYQGEIKNGKMDGFGEFFWKTNKKYIGHYKNDKRNGFGVFIFKGENNGHNNDKLKPTMINSENSALEGYSAYIGFWKSGNMDGFGIKINSKNIKFGIWDNGQKKKWFENEKAIKCYLEYNVPKQFFNFFLSSELIIYNFLEKCIYNDKDIVPFNNQL